MLKHIAPVMISFVCISVWGQERTLVFGDNELKYQVTFDPLKISESEVRKLVPLSPYSDDSDAKPFSSGISAQRNIKGEEIRDKTFAAPELELCIDDDPLYLPCSTRDLRDPNFFANAETNILEGERELSLLDNMSYPEQLRPVVKYLRQSLSFSLSMQRARLEYFKTWNIEALKQNYGTFDPVSDCGQVLRQIDSSSSKDDKYSLVSFQWRNCVGGGLHHLYFGRYPMQSWVRFLKDYGMSDKYTEDFPD
jgi:hypothetical protein